MRSTLPPIQWVPRALRLGDKWSRLEAGYVFSLSFFIFDNCNDLFIEAVSNSNNIALKCKIIDEWFGNYFGRKHAPRNRHLNAENNENHKEISGKIIDLLGEIRSTFE